MMFAARALPSRDEENWGSQPPAEYRDQALRFGVWTQRLVMRQAPHRQGSSGAIGVSPGHPLLPVKLVSAGRNLVMHSTARQVGSVEFGLSACRVEVVSDQCLRRPVTDE